MVGPRAGVAAGNTRRTGGPRCRHVDESLGNPKEASNERFASFPDGRGFDCIAGRPLRLQRGESAKAAPFTLVFPIGLVCEDIAVNVDVADNARAVTRTFTTPDGTVRVLTAGKGSDLVFYDPNHPDDTFALKGSGAVNWSTSAADGTTTPRR